MADPRGSSDQDVVDRMLSRFMQVLDTMEVKSRPVRQNLKRELKEAARDARRLVDQGLTSIDSFINNPQDRPVVLMTRLTKEDLEKLDTLKSAGLFDSRSQGASYLIRVGLEAKADLLHKVKNAAEKIKDLKEDLKRSMD